MYVIKIINYLFQSQMLFADLRTLLYNTQYILHTMEIRFQPFNKYQTNKRVLTRKLKNIENGMEPSIKFL